MPTGAYAPGYGNFSMGLGGMRRRKERSYPLERVKPNAPVAPQVPQAPQAPQSVPAPRVPGANLAFEVSALDQRARLPGPGMSPETAAAMTKALERARATRPQGASLRVLTPEEIAAAGSKTRIEVPMPRVSPAVEAAAAGPEGLIPREAILPRTAPTAPWKTIRPEAVDLYAQQERPATTPIAPAAASAGPGIPMPRVPKSLEQLGRDAGVQVDPLAVRKAVESFGFSDKEAAEIDRRARAGDPEAQNMAVNAVMRTKQDEEAKALEKQLKAQKGEADDKRRDLIAGANAAVSGAHVVEERAYQAYTRADSDLKEATAALEKESAKSKPDEGRSNRLRQEIERSRAAVEQARSAHSQAQELHNQVRAQQLEILGKEAAAGRVTPLPLPPRIGRTEAESKRIQETVDRASDTLRKELLGWVDKQLLGEFKTEEFSEWQPVPGSEEAKEVKGQRRIHVMGTGVIPDGGSAKLEHLDDILGRLKGRIGAIKGKNLSQKERADLALGIVAGWVEQNPQYVKEIKDWQGRRYAPVATRENMPTPEIPNGRGRVADDPVLEAAYQEAKGDPEKMRKILKSKNYLYAAG